MINYLKQYADKTFEELVNSLIWFDNPLKLKAIFAKLPVVEPQDLQSVIDINGEAFFNNLGGEQHVSFFKDEDGASKAMEISSDSADYGSSFSLNDYGISITNTKSIDYSGLESASISILEGIFELSQNNPSGINTLLKFNTPIVATILNFPNKTLAGDYTIDVTPNSTYTVGTLPSGVLNDKAIVTDATAPTYLGVLVGGGTVVTPVWHNGTIWVSR